MILERGTAVRLPYFHLRSPYVKQ